MCEADEPGRKTSSGVSSKPATALATIQPNVSCVCVTPFGLPVLPEVKKMNAGVGAAAAGSARRWRCRLHQVFEAAGAGRRSAPYAMRPSGNCRRAALCGEVVIALGVGHESRRAADFERVIDFRRLVAIVERRGDEPGFEAGQVVDDECAAIRQQRRDAVARLEARALK